MTGSGEDLLRKALAESIKAMAAGGPQTVAEVAAAGIAPTSDDPAPVDGAPATPVNVLTVSR